QYSKCKYTTARNSMRLRPTPWPNEHTSSSPILSIINLHPPPWPNKLPNISPGLSIANHIPHPGLNQCHRQHKIYPPIWFTPHSQLPPWPIIPFCTTQP